jgi:hypothetical protein
MAIALKRSGLASSEARNQPAQTQEDMGDSELTSVTPPSSQDLLALQHEVARYVAQMSAELGGMARSAKLDLLAYFLDMARVEASIQIERTDS